MAKKVNTKFLFLLVATLTLVIGAVAGVIILVNMANYNPEKLITSADNFLKQGDIPHAIENYQRVTVIYVRNHQNIQAGDMLVKIGDLYSKSAENNVQYQRAFQMAIKAWQ